MGLKSKGMTYKQPSTQVLKTLPAPDGPIVEVTDSSASLRGGSEYGFFSYRESGNIIKGPLSIAAKPHEVRLSGVTTLNPLITSGFASTIVTPIPTTVWSIPMAGMLGPIKKDVAIMAAMIGSMGVG